jgi:hypothetical protein
MCQMATNTYQEALSTTASNVSDSAFEIDLNLKFASAALVRHI